MASHDRVENKECYLENVLKRGDHPKKDQCIQLISTLPVLTIEKEIYEIVDFYIDKKLMPHDPRGDAIHLTIASFHNCQFLLTWNCAHLANANKFEHVRNL